MKTIATGLFALLFAVGIAAPSAAVETVDPDEDVYAFGGAPFLGSTGALELNRRVVDMASTPSGQGYWEVASDGGVFSFGDAVFYGSTGDIALNQPIVGMTSTPTGNGYWFVARDGGVFSFGDAQFFGSMGGVALNEPIVGMAATPTGDGYWLAAADGGIFSFGDAAFLGSMGGVALNEPVVGMAATPSGDGYWIVARDGGIFSFGDAQFFGSTGGIRLNRTIVDMAATASGNGYWLAARDGGIFTFGPDAMFFGSAADDAIDDPVVAIAATPQGDGYWLLSQQPILQSCTNAMWTVRFPNDWFTNTGQVTERCRYFNPEPFVLDEATEPLGVAILTRVENRSLGVIVPTPLDTFTEVHSRANVTVDGRSAVRYEATLLEPALLPSGTTFTTYAVALGENRTYLAQTYDLRANNYDENVDVLDTMMETIDFVA